MFPKHRKDGLVIQHVDGETLVYDLKTHRAKCLNTTVSLVWEKCDGHRSLEDISGDLSLELGHSVPLDVIRVALDQLKSEELLESGSEASYLAGFSRREAIRKIGLATVMALPLITSITVPMAAAAQSVCIPVRQGCTCVQGSCDGNRGNPCTVNSACASAVCRCICAGNGGTNGDCVV